MKTKKRVFHKNKRRVQRKRIWQRIIRRLKRKHHQRGSRHAFRRNSNRRRTSKKSRSRDILLLPDYGVSSSSTTSTPQPPISSSTTPQSQISSSSTQINNAVDNSLYPSEGWDFGNDAIATPHTPETLLSEIGTFKASDYTPTSSQTEALVSLALVIMGDAEASDVEAQDLRGGGGDGGDGDDNTQSTEEAAARTAAAAVNAAVSPPPSTPPSQKKNIDDKINNLSGKKPKNSKPRTSYGSNESDGGSGSGSGSGEHGNGGGGGSDSNGGSEGNNNENYGNMEDNNENNEDDSEEEDESGEDGGNSGGSNGGGGAGGGNGSDNNGGSDSEGHNNDNDEEEELRNLAECMANEMENAISMAIAECMAAEGDDDQEDEPDDKMSCASDFDELKKQLFFTPKQINLIVKLQHRKVNNVDMDPVIGPVLDAFAEVKEMLECIKSGNRDEVTQDRIRRLFDNIAAAWVEKFDLESNLGQKFGTSHGFAIMLAFAVADCIAFKGTTEYDSMDTDHFCPIPAVHS